MATSTYRGHKIHSSPSENWYFTETGQRVSDNPDIQCKHCDKPNHPNGHDGCLGELPFVNNACCGHGELGMTYVQFKGKNLYCVRGWKASVIQKILKLFRKR